MSLTPIALTLIAYRVQFIATLNMMVVSSALCSPTIILPQWNSFLCPLSSRQPQSTFDPVASFVSAVDLHRDCPPTLLKALTDLHTDHAVWMKSYLEEKCGIESLNTYKKITLGEYRTL